MRKDVNETAETLERVVASQLNNELVFFVEQELELVRKKAEKRHHSRSQSTGMDVGLRFGMINMLVVFVMAVLLTIFHVV